MEMKFRAWDKKLNKFAPNFWIGKDGSIRHYVNELQHQICFEDRYIIMQYIWVEDKNKKEIYVGDIAQIRTQSGRIENFTVEYGIHRRDMKSGWTVDIPGFAFMIDGKPTFPIANNYLNGHDLDIIEIIGNIYENKELMLDG